MKTKDTKRKTRTGAARRIGALFLALTMTFGTWTPAFAEEPAPGIEEHVEIPAEETEKGTPEVQETPAQDKAEADGLEIGPEIVQEAVGEKKIPAPTITKAFIGTNTVSGGNLHRDRVDGKAVRATVYVTVKAQDGTVKATVSVTPKSGNTWSVNLPAGVKLADGDTVTAYQELNGNRSPDVTANAELSMAGKNKDKLKMPSGEIWIEKTNANLVSDDEQAEAQQMLKDANSEISDKIKTIKFSIDGTEHAYYEVTYTDGSTSGKIEATSLKIKSVTEKSAAPTIQEVKVADRQISVTLEKEVAKGTKFYFIKAFTDGQEENFCQDGNCKADKSNPQEMTQAVSIDGTTVTFPVTDDVLELGREFGIAIKEPHKFLSCAKSTPVLGIPDKVDVRDPHKLTDADKKAIDKAIRDANTVDGVSKMPDGTGFINDPAFIEFDDNGDVRIISPNDVEVNWVDGKPVYQKNDDGTGTYKLKANAKVYEFAAKDLVQNLAPKYPSINVDDVAKFDDPDKNGKVTITPPAYKDPGEDTDVASYTVKYKDENKKEKTLTAMRGEDNKWTLEPDLTAEENSGVKFDAGTGVITLDVNKIEVGGMIEAQAKDKGGFAPDDEEPLVSFRVGQPLEKAKITFNPNGGKQSSDQKKQMNPATINKGGKFKIPDCTFEPPYPNTPFLGWEIGGVKYTKVGKTWQYQKGDSTEATTEIQITKDTEFKALWPAMVTITVDPQGGNWGGSTGNIVTKVPKGDNYILPAAPVKEGYVFQYYEGSKFDPGDTYKANEDHGFKAIWAEEVKVTYNAGEGSGTMEDVKLAKDSKYKLAANGFTAPENKEFQGWMIDGTEYTTGAEIEVTKDITVTAVWKEKPNSTDDDNTGGDTGGNNGGDHSSDKPGTKPGDKPGANPNKPNDPNAPGQPSDPKDPSEPWGKGNTDIDALLRRMKALRNDPAVRKILEGQRVIPKAGVGASTTAVEPVLFPVDLLPAPKKREEE